MATDEQNEQMQQMLRGKGINPDGVGSEETPRTTNNMKIIDELAIEDDMNKFIREDAVQTHETNRLVHVLFKHIRQRNTEIRTNLELFLDNWAFQHGGITKANFRECVRAVVRYGVSVAARANAKMEAAEARQERAAEGSLANFADHDEMRDHPL